MWTGAFRALKKLPVLVSVMTPSQKGLFALLHWQFGKELLAQRAVLLSTVYHDFTNNVERYTDSSSTVHIQGTFSARCMHSHLPWVPWTNWGHGCQGAPLLLFSSLHNVELSVHEQYQHISLPGQRECRKPEEPMETTEATTIKDEDHFLPSP